MTGVRCPRGAPFPWAFGAALADQALVSGCAFLLSILLLRGAGPEGYGVFVLSWAAVTFLSALHQALVIAPVLTRLPKKSVEEGARMEGAYVVVHLGFVLLAGVALGTAAGFLGGDAAELAFPLAAAGAAFLAQDGARRMLFARARAVRALAVDALAYGGQVAAAGLLGGAGAARPAAVLWVTAASFGGAAVWALALLRPVVGGGRDAAAALRENWSFSRWMLATAAAQWFSGTLFLVVAGSVLGTAAAGVVRAAQNLVGATHVIFLALENHLPVRAAAILAREGRRAMLSYVGRVARRVGSVVVLYLAAVGAAPSFWMELAYGPDLASHGHVLAWFAALYGLVFAGTLLRFVARTLEETALCFRGSLLAGAAGAAAVFPLAGRWGVTGVLVALTLAQAAAAASLAAGIWKALR
ncbi:MAG TPA: hypothetical protein VNO22_16810 [Planctomycetota bacterium]|nr:hypothetical protein [Planctomycetota bacterium]